MRILDQRYLKIAALLGLLALAPLSQAALARPGSLRPERSSFFLALGGCKDHKWVKETKKTWVPPVYTQKLVGYDQNGKPIYEKVLVKEGYYKTTIIHKCAKCGKIK